MNRIACESDLNNVFTQIYIDPFLLFFLGSLPSMGFPGGSDGKESVCNAGDLGSVPGSRRSPGKWNGYPLQYSCLENPHGQRSLAGCSLWGHTQSDVTERLCAHMS